MNVTILTTHLKNVPYACTWAVIDIPLVVRSSKKNRRDTFEDQVKW